MSAVDATCAPVDPTPLPRARVAIHCPGRPAPLVEVLSDDRGRFELRRDGILSKACWVRISEPDYEEAIYPIGSLCAVEGTLLEGCHAFAVQAELPRRTSANGSPETSSNDREDEPSVDGDEPAADDDESVSDED